MILRCEMIITIIATTERLFHIIDKKKEKALNFYADVIFCLFIFIILLSISCFLLSYFNKNVKETIFFGKEFLWLGLLIKFSFLLVLFKYRAVSDANHCFLNNGSENGVITSNPWGFFNTGKKLVFYLIVIKGYV